MTLEEIDQLFEDKKPEHVHLGTDTTMGRLDIAKTDKEADNSVTVLERRDS